MKNSTQKLAVMLMLLISAGLSTSLANTARYRLTLRSDPATTIVIGWDQISGSNPTVYYGTTDFGTNWSSYPSSQTPSRIIASKGMNNHFARLTGLQPDRAYYFVIRDSQGTSQRFWFKTAPSSSTQRLSFIAGGDSRNNRTPRINANKLVSKLRPHAVFFGGDMTANDTNSEWIDWFNDWQNTIGTDGRIIPIVAARGNHESSNSSIYNLFDTPSSSVYYALTFGGNLIRSYTLNTEMSISGSQTNWLNSDLAANSGVKWKMAQYHKPMRPHVSSKSEGNNQYNYWSQPFYNNGVKLVVESDAHTVKTTWPVRPSTGSGSDEGFIRDDGTGSVYVGEGCWGAPLRTNNDDKNWTRNSGRFNQFKWIFVDQNKIEVRTVKVDNASSVGTVSDNNIFSAPSNLDIWNPSAGAVVTILPSTTTGGGNGGTTTTISKRVASSNDDAEQATSGTMYRSSSDLELVYDSYQSAGNQLVGMRFTGLNIPKTASIVNAYIQFTVDETGSNSTSLTIRGHDVDDSGTFGSANYDISNRSLTSAAVSWSPASWTSVGAAGSAQRTPNIKSIIQEIVNRSGWSLGNDISIIINGSGKRTAESYDGSSSRAPVLVVEYSNSNTFARTAAENPVNSGLIPIATAQNFTLYPNPVSDELTVDLSGFESAAEASMLIYSISGEIVYSEEFKLNGPKTISMKDLNSGTYLINIVVAGKAYVQRVIKN